MTRWLSESDAAEHIARMEKLKAQGTVRTHRLSNDEEQAGSEYAQGVKTPPRASNPAARAFGPASFSLPWPPSTNHYWYRNRNGSVRIGEKGVAYRAEVKLIAIAQRLQTQYGRLAISITAYPPDKRRRDLDNLWKAALDALQHAGVVLDDNQFDKLEIVRGEKRSGGMLAVRIGQLASHKG